jgi:hypothetical protein
MKKTNDPREQSIAKTFETVEEIEYEYIAPDVARLFATTGEEQPDGIYEGDGTNVTFFSSNCSLSDGD